MGSIFLGCLGLHVGPSGVLLAPGPLVLMFSLLPFFFFISFSLVISSLFLCCFASACLLSYCCFVSFPSLSFWVCLCLSHIECLSTKSQNKDSSVFISLSLSLSASESLLPLFVCKPVSISPHLSLFLSLPLSLSISHFCVCLPSSSLLCASILSLPFPLPLCCL